MSLPNNLYKDLSMITAQAAIASFHYIGKNDKNLADKAAVDVIRKKLNKMSIDGEVVIGEGVLDEAPMLYLGEKLGTGSGIKVDIAVDPVEGTNFVAKNMPGGLSVIAVSEKGNLFNAPETYMSKIAVSKDIPSECVDLDFSVEKNINNISDFKKVKNSDLTVCILDRPRHKNIIEKLIKLNVKLKLISDGDISGALLVADKKNNVDIFLGIGGGPEGVLAASALDAYNCKFQGRFIFDNENDKHKAKELGIQNLEKKYEIHELIRGESIFCASGITDGDLVNGVKLHNNTFYTETLVTHKNLLTNIIKYEIPNT
mgnify:CR=1 FL=1